MSGGLLTFAHQIAAGLAMGGIYSCLALAVVMTYQSTGHINFAQGEMAALSTYVGWWMLLKLGLPYWVMIPLTLALSFAFGFGVQRVLVRPLAKAPVLSLVTLFVALLIIINAANGLVFSQDVLTMPSPFAALGIPDTLLMSAHELGSLAVTLVILSLVFAFFRYTPLGLVMRASAENPLSSQLSGVRVGRMHAIGWGVAAVVGAVSGLLVAPNIMLEPSMMGGVLIYGFAAALVGGINNPWGAVTGGFLVGITENLLGAYVIGTDLKFTAALFLMVLVLIFMPAGLFGRQFAKRV